MNGFESFNFETSERPASFALCAYQISDILTPGESFV